MDILVLLKQVPSTFEIKVDKNNNIDRSVGDTMLNPADSSALSIALKLVAIYGGTVSCLSMGPKTAERTLRDAAIEGADDLYLLSDGRLAGADSYITSYCLAKAIESIGVFDLILCGQRSVDGETGQVGPEIAGFLNCSSITSAVSVDYYAECFRCKCTSEKEERILEAKSPLVVTISPFPVVSKLPTLSALRSANDKKIKKLSAEDIGLSSNFNAFDCSPTRVIKMRAINDYSRKCSMISAEEISDEIEKALGQKERRI